MNEECVVNVDSAMNEDGAGLVYRGALPVSIKKVAQMPGDYELSRVNHSNEVLLKAGLILNDHHDLDEYHELTPFLLKQDLKLNLLLNLIGELVQSSNEFPGSRNLQITPKCLILDAGNNMEALVAGDIVCMNIHLVAEMPKALSFFGVVAKVEQTGVHNQTQKVLQHALDGECRIEFLSLDQQVSDQLEKILFRFHRRKIAQQKSAEQSEYSEVS